MQYGCLKHSPFSMNLRRSIIILGQLNLLDYIEQAFLRLFGLGILRLYILDSLCYM